MKTYTIEYKTIAYFTTKVKANSQEEAEKIAQNLDKEDFTFSDTLNSTWEYNQTIEEG